MSVSLTFRCPDDLAAFIKSQTELTNLDKTSVVVSMLRASLPSVLISARSDLPEVAAIYFVWSLDRLLYIGKTENLRRRFYSHHRIVQFLEAGNDTHIGWFEVDAQNLPEVESSFLELLETELNGESVVASPSGVVPVSFRCPNDLLEVIDTLGRERYPAENKNGCDRSKTLMDIIQAGIQALSDGSVNIPIRKTDSKTDSKTIDAEEVEAIVENRLTVAIAVIQTQLEDFLQAQLKERIDEVQSQLEDQLESLRGKLKARLVR